MMNTIPQTKVAKGSAATILIALAITLIANSGDFERPVPDQVQVEPREKHVRNLINDADHVVDAGEGHTYGIGIGIKDKDGSFVPTSHKWQELENFFRMQKHKSLVVVRIQPGSDWYVNNREKEIGRIRKSFLSVGFSRVVIVRCLAQGHILDFDSGR